MVPANILKLRHEWAYVERKHMVDFQLKDRGIVDSLVLKAFSAIPREHFARVNDKLYAYDDYSLQIGYGQTMSRPYIIAYMLQALEIKIHNKILEIGTGSGYQTALLHHITRNVFSVERIPLLLPNLTAIRKRTVICVINALVDATPISGPA